MMYNRGVNYLQQNIHFSTMSLSSSTFLRLEYGKKFWGAVIQLQHEFGLKIYSGNLLELSVDLKKRRKKHKGPHLDFNKMSKVNLH